MIGFGVLLVILGFGSLILNNMGYEFTIISWASDMQPWFGIGLGVIGLVLIVAGAIAKRKTTVVVNNNQPGPGYPPAQGYQAPPAGYENPPAGYQNPPQR